MTDKAIKDEINKSKRLELSLYLQYENPLVGFEKRFRK